MLEMLRALVRHQGWADSQIIEAIRGNAAAGNEEIRGILHHMVLVQRYFLTLLEGRQFDYARESVIPASLDQMAGLFGETREALLGFMERSAEEDLQREFEIPRLEAKLKGWQILTQVVLHSQAHRAQCASLLRKAAGTAPTTDFILWAKAPG